MSTVVLGPPPPEVDALLGRRRALGQDRFDEVWEGSVHVSPAPGFAHGRVVSELLAVLRPAARAAGLTSTDAFNLGEPEDYRVPDVGLHRESSGGTWMATAALVVEVVSPDDESYAKFPFYARHRVDEVLIADPPTRSIRLWVLSAGVYDETGRSELLATSADEIAAAVDWPPTG